MGCCSPSPAVKAVFKEEIVPNMADKAVYMLAPALAHPGVDHLGRDPGCQGRADHRRRQHRLPWIPSPSAASKATASSWPGGAATTTTRCSALRSSAQMISYELPLGVFLVSILMLAGGFSLVSLVETRARWEWIWLWLMSPALLHLHPGGDESQPVRPARNGKRAGLRLPDRVWRHQVRPLLHGRIHQHDHHQRHHGDALLRRLPAALGLLGDVIWLGPFCPRRQGHHPALPLHLGARQRRALRRPAHAVQLEVSAARSARLYDYHHPVDGVL